MKQIKLFEKKMQFYGQEILVHVELNEPKEGEHSITGWLNGDRVGQTVTAHEFDLELKTNEVLSACQDAAQRVDDKIKGIYRKLENMGFTVGNPIQWPKSVLKIYQDMGKELPYSKL